VAPYITAWSGETDPPCVVIGRADGIGYLDETVADRDGDGVLWLRTEYRPGAGRPEFAKVHPMRQRRAMRRLLCQVCAAPADRTEGGVLWLLRDFRHDWPMWPDGMGVTEPPICRSCVRLSMRACPALRRGAAVVRARGYRLVGVDGVQYRRDGNDLAVFGASTVAYDDPAIRWVRAAALVRQLHDCRLLAPSELVGDARVPDFEGRHRAVGTLGGYA
jgi:hypothetical protein